MSLVEAARHSLFGDALACESDMPAALRSRAPDAVTVERALDHAETVLRSLALIEDAPHDDEGDRGNHDPGIQRLEAKLNLVLESLAGILRRERTDLPTQTLRWSRLGAEMLHTEATPPERGFLLLQPLVWVPQRLELPVRVLAHEPAGDGRCRVWLRFDPLPPQLESALERHLFRLHRRQLAQRKPGPH